MLVIWNDKRIGSKWLVNIVKMSLFFWSLPENVTTLASFWKAYFWKVIRIRSQNQYFREFHQRQPDEKMSFSSQHLRMWHKSVLHNEMNDYSPWIKWIFRNSLFALGSCLQGRCGRKIWAMSYTILSLYFREAEKNLSRCKQIELDLNSNWICCDKRGKAGSQHLKKEPPDK